MAGGMRECVSMRDVETGRRQRGRGEEGWGRGGREGRGGGRFTFGDYGLLVFLHDELLELFLVGVGEFGEVDVCVHGCGSGGGWVGYRGS